MRILIVAIALTVPLMAGTCEGGGMAPTVHMCKSYEEQEQCNTHEECEWAVDQCKAK